MASASCSRRNSASPGTKTARNSGAPPISGTMLTSKLLGHEQRRRAGVLQREQRLARMQLGIDRHRDQPSEPDAVERFEILRTVLHRQADALARRQPDAGAQVAGNPRGPFGERAIVADEPGAMIEGRTIRIGAGGCATEAGRCSCAHPSRELRAATCAAWLLHVHGSTKRRISKGRACRQLISADAIAEAVVICREQ